MALGDVRSRFDQRGFTLVELMVGLLLSLLTVLVIMQVTSVAEGRRQTLSAGGDAQVNGALALLALQRDIQQAGFGATAQPDAMGCPVRARYGSGAAFGFTLAPVVIARGANGAPAAITVLQSHAVGSATPTPVLENHPAAASQFVVESTLGVRAGDVFIAVPPGGAWESAPADWWCTLYGVSADGANALDLTHLPHVTDSAAGGWNQGLAPQGDYIGSRDATQARSYLLNMGAIVARTYAIGEAGNLQVSERSPADGSLSTQDLFAQIVNLQALYGKDTDGDGQVDTYDDTTPATNAQWQQVIAVRIALVARSTKFEKEAVTAAAPLWDVGASTAIAGPATTACHGASRCIALQINQLADWQHYRYKVYDTLVPLRNVLWNS